jgi:hypothetical protein
MKTSPVFAVLHKSGELYWFDLAWGQGWNPGSGYLPAIPWGEEKNHVAYCRDNRVLIDGDDCEVYLICWTQEQEPEYYVPRLYISCEVAR